MALNILYANPGLPVEYELDSDPTVFAGWGGTNAEIGSILYRTDSPSIYRKTGPLNVNWTLQSSVSTDLTTFIAEFSNPEVDPTAPAVGNPVTILSTAPSAGQAMVRTATAGNNSLGAPLPNVAGLITAINSTVNPPLVTVKTSGFVTLTTAQWDAITLSGPGGLTRGAIYYLSFGFNDFGHLTTVVTVTPTTFISRVGIALNSTTMLLTLPTQSPTLV